MVHPVRHERGPVPRLLLLLRVPLLLRVRAVEEVKDDVVDARRRVMGRVPVRTGKQCLVRPVDRTFGPGVDGSVFRHTRGRLPRRHPVSQGDLTTGGWDPLVPSPVYLGRETGLGSPKSGP